MLLKSYVCYHVLRLSTVSSMQCRPGSSNVLQWYFHLFSVWCATRHYDLDSFLIHTNMLSSSQGSKELLHVDLSIMQNALNCFWSSSLSIDSFSRQHRVGHEMRWRLDHNTLNSTCWTSVETSLLHVSRCSIFSRASLFAVDVLPPTSCVNSPLVNSPLSTTPTCNMYRKQF